MAYITYERGVTVVRCKGGCQTVLRRGPKLTPDYAELVIAMREPNGLLSKHETAMCIACKRRILNNDMRPGELDAIYAEDVEQWITSALRAGFPRAEVLEKAERQAARTPISALREQSRIGAP